MAATTTPDQTSTDTGTQDRPPQGALAPGSRGYKMLMTAIVVMGVMLIVGVIALGVLMAGRMGRGAAPVSAPATAPAALGAPFSVNLNEPLGSQIVSIAPLGDRLALHIVGGGPSRVFLVDPRTGLVTGRIMLGE